MRASTTGRAVAAIGVAVLASALLIGTGTARAETRSGHGGRLISTHTGLPAGILPTRTFTGSESATSARAATTAPPHLIYYGGPVVSHVSVQSVLWGSGTYLPEVNGSTSPNMDTFFAHVLNSRYLSWLSEYNTPSQSIGLGSFAGRTTITPSLLAGGALVDDSAIQSELESQIGAGHLAAPTLDATGQPDTVYALFFPSGTTVCNGSDCSGAQFCAYHGSFRMTIAGHSRNIRYMVLPDSSSAVGGCGSPTANTPLRVLQSYTSHELVETITDPDVALATSNGPPLGWYDQTYGEAGDICVGVDGTDAVITGTDGNQYVVQKNWSNAHNACTAGFFGVDRTPPVVSFTRPMPVFQRSSRMTVSYHATDNQSVSSYDLGYRFANWNGRFSSYHTLALATHATSVTVTGYRGKEYCFRVRARDASGNVSPWTHDRCTSIPLDDRALRVVSGHWTRVSDPGAYGRSVIQTRGKGAALRLSGVQGRRIALLVTTCPGCGRVAIYLNGAYWQTVSTYATQLREQVFLFPRAFGLRTTTVTLRSATRAKVIVDGFAVLR